MEPDESDRVSASRCGPCGLFGDGDSKCNSGDVNRAGDDDQLHPSVDQRSNHSVDHRSNHSVDHRSNHVVEHRSNGFVNELGAGVVRRCSGLALRSRVHRACIQRAMTARGEPSDRCGETFEPS